MAASLEDGAAAPRLLVSVRDGSEVPDAIAGGGDIIDVKEPLAGPLGAPSPECVRSVANCLGRQRPLSVAVGELVDLDRLDLEALLAIEPASYFKIGLSSVAQDRRLWEAFEAFCVRVRRVAAPVAVAYADWRAAASCAPREVLDRGYDAGCRTFLIDTYQKNGRDLWAELEPTELRELVDYAHQLGGEIAVAGSLALTNVAWARMAGADIVGVRGAACREGRNSRIDAECVRRIATQLKRPGICLTLPHHS